MQSVTVFGNEKLCGDPDHIECHEPAVVLVRHIPDGVHMPEDVTELWLCSQHHHERQQHDRRCDCGNLLDDDGKCDRVGCDATEQCWNCGRMVVRLYDDGLCSECAGVDFQ